MADHLYARRFDDTINGDLGRRLPVEELEAIAAELGVGVSPKAGKQLEQSASKWAQWKRRRPHRIVVDVTDDQVESVRRVLIQRSGSTLANTIAAHTDIEMTPHEARECAEILVAAGVAHVYRHGRGNNAYGWGGAE